MELLARIRVNLLLQLHRVGPGALGLVQRNQQELGLAQVVSGHLALLEATRVAALEVERLAQAVQASRAVGPVALVVAVAQAVLLL